MAGFKIQQGGFYNRFFSIDMYKLLTFKMRTIKWSSAEKFLYSEFTFGLDLYQGYLPARFPCINTHMNILDTTLSSNHRS